MRGGFIQQLGTVGGIFRSVYLLQVPRGGKKEGRFHLASDSATPQQSPPLALLGDGHAVVAAEDK